MIQYSRPLYYTVPEEIRSFPSTVLYSARGGSGASREDPELPGRIRSFPSTVLYSARGRSGASRPLSYTVPEDEPELPVHCIIQCQSRIRSFPSTVLYSARGGSGASRPPFSSPFFLSKEVSNLFYAFFRYFYAFYAFLVCPFHWKCPAFFTDFLRTFYAFYAFSSPFFLSKKVFHLFLRIF